MNVEAALDHPDFTIALKDPVMFQVACGLQHIHDQDMLHRDIKPENILIACMNPVRAVLADLGVSARVVNEPYLTGTETYWAPEYLKSKIPTFASDIFALGLTFLKMIEHDHTDVADGLELRAYSMKHPPARWPVLIRQMTYDSPGDRPQLQVIQRAIQSGQDFRPNEESDRRNAPAPGSSCSAKSASLASQDHTPVHTSPYGAASEYSSATQLQADGGQLSSPLRTARPSSATAVAERPSNGAHTSGTVHGDLEMQRQPSDPESFPRGDLTSGAPTQSLTAQGQRMQLQKSPRHRPPAKRYDVLRRVRAGRIAKPKAKSGSNPTSDTPRVESARPGSWRAEEVARELEKTVPDTV